jgi:molecular chaperone DnaK (HSP70)
VRPLPSSPLLPSDADFPTFDSVYSLKAQLSDNEGLGGKLSAENKKSIEAQLKQAQQWLEDEGANASAEDIDEHREALQAAVAPITAKVVRPLPFALS